jgi:hypothetical protein
MGRVGKNNLNYFLTSKYLCEIFLQSYLLSTVGDALER